MYQQSFLHSWRRDLEGWAAEECSRGRDRYTSDNCNKNTAFHLYMPAKSQSFSVGIHGSAETRPPSGRGVTVDRRKFSPRDELSCFMLNAVTVIT